MNCLLRSSAQYASKTFYRPHRIFGVHFSTDNVPLLYDIFKNDFERVMTSTVPVIVNCYADFCPPSKKFMPILEASILKFDGEAHLARLNVEKNDRLLENLDIRSVPTLLMYDQGHLVDRVSGTLSRTQTDYAISQLIIKSHSKTSVEYFFSEGKKYEAAKKITLANKAYMKVFEHKKVTKKMKAFSVAALMRVALLDKDIETAQMLSRSLSYDFAEEREGEYEIVRSLLILGLTVEASHRPSLIELESSIPYDQGVKYDLALHSAVAGKTEEAVDMLFKIVKRNPKWEDGKAKKLILRILLTLGKPNKYAKAKRKELEAFLESKEDSS